jgi:hypothetical protein
MPVDAPAMNAPAMNAPAVAAADVVDPGLVSPGEGWPESYGKVRAGAEASADGGTGGGFGQCAVAGGGQVDAVADVLAGVQV